MVNRLPHLPGIGKEHASVCFLSMKPMKADQLSLTGLLIIMTDQKVNN